ncbi:3-hydroxyacyl-ACP dehydratase FabZ family protein [Geobacter sp. SVR]|uniref:3-hydroxyacyl-ACP dehydratase FabZ family protein n=1 Tax=Geobacter sp. SVR TaxID=2495594 RepID=UPI00143EF8F1|nr:hotdog domain-containing protein [Geobacter sp. SVR]BCS54294.1 hydroxymyristoyl-ACP dehydratase [Geobacter sp. SVR]GCF85847.1 hydroxymyristoyl-ACP dehydratase [Geobacter sp. SVR]
MIFWEAALFNPDPAAYLPHRYPFLMLDRLLALEPGVSARAERRVTDAPEAFPQVYLIESIAQLGGILAAQEQGEGGFLATVDHAEFGGQVLAGDTLTIAARVVKSFGRLALIEGEVTCGGNILAQARMTLGIGRL